MGNICKNHEYKVVFNSTPENVEKLRIIEYNQNAEYCQKNQKNQRCKSGGFYEEEYF
jgi:hypothetical protein